MSEPRKLGDIATDVGRKLAESNREAAASVAAFGQHAEGVDEYEQEERARISRERETTWERAIPKRFRGARLEHATAGELELEAVREWCETREGNLIILGPVGVGKTHLAVAALRACFEDTLSVGFYPVVELLDLLRPGGNDTNVRHIAHSVLLLDDLGTEKGTDWTTERLYALINRRWLEQLPTIVTTNIAPLELEASLDARLYSRLVDGATAVRLSGTDRRRA